MYGKYCMDISYTIKKQPSREISSESLFMLIPHSEKYVPQMLVSDFGQTVVFTVQI